MKIAYLTGSGIPGVAANTVQVMKMCQALGRLGHDVTLWANDGAIDADPFAFYGVERVFALERGPRTPGLAGGFRELAERSARLLRAGRPDLFVSRVPRYLLPVAPLGRPLMYEVHSMDRRPQTRATLRALFALPNFARLVSISSALRDDMCAEFPSLRPAATLVLHDAADPMPDAEPLPQAALGGRDGVVRVGYVGGLYRGKGVEMVRDAARALPELDFHCVGGTPAEIAAWRAEGMTDNVIFHGHVPHGALPRYYARFDILVAPFGTRVSVFGGGGDTSRWMSPLKVFEYMSARKAMVCSDLPVLREVLVPEHTALMPPPGDVGAWVGAIGRLAGDTRLRHALASAAYDTFRARYTWEQRAAAMVALP